MLNELMLFLAFSFLGTFIGVITGLIPGLHTNNVAILLLSISFAFPSIYAIILLAAAAISHTFLDIIPSVFIGAPEEDTALSILPAHRLLLNGEAYKAISISAKSSLLSIFASFLLLLPFKFIIGSPLQFYSILQKLMPLILISISAILIFTSKNIGKAAFIFILSGLLGVAIFNLPNSIFPALAGLFGAPAILLAKKEEMPEQVIEEDGDIDEKDVLSGIFSGGLVAILPGVSSAIATTLALEIRGEGKDENVISVLSAANTATNFFVLAILFILLKARSGFAIAIQHLMNVPKWENMMPREYLLILSSILIASILSFYLTKCIGKFVAKNISEIDYSRILIASLVILIAMVIIFSGIIGLAIFIVSTLVGITCLKMNVRRSNLMGILLIPLILIYIFHSSNILFIIQSALNGIWSS